MNEYRLSVERLKNRCTLEGIDFETTADVEPAKEIIGQKEAVKAINFGLDIDHPGYNIFVVNFSGCKELEYIKALVSKKAQGERKSVDWCYVYNFSNPSKPRYLKLAVGLGREFKRDMEDLIDNIEGDIAELFAGEEYIKQKREIKSKYQKISTGLINTVQEKVKEAGYLLEREKGGFAIIPIKDDESPMREEEYKNLSQKEQDQINEDTRKIQQLLDQSFTKIEKWNEEFTKEIESLDYQLAENIIDNYLDELIQKYSDFDKVVDYLGEVRDDILHNLDDFKEPDEPNNSLLFFAEDNSKDYSTKYEVNLLVDNSNVEGSPVIVESNPTYYNLNGRVEYSNKSGELATDFTHIRSGSLHQANGGYLILEAKDLLTNFKSWQLIKRVLKSRRLKMEHIGEEFDKIPLATLEPQPIPIDVKIVIIGDIELYYLLYQYDQEFKELFKVKSDFKREMELSQENTYQIVQFISRECQENGFLHLNRQAVAKIIEYLSRRVDSQKKVTTKFTIITDLLCEADEWARLEGKDIIGKEEIEKSIIERIKRSSNYEERIQELYRKHKLLIESEGWKVGEINGLSVLDLGEYSFGKPVKITASVYRGNRGVVNIERETKMSGKIHNKGLLILTAYLGEKFAQEVPLSLSASLCFEQLYSGIDGDSASSTELYVLLSALAEVPINQGIAVTGSINQKGEVQPIGGVNEKIEGFFKLCKSRGLTGEQGVIIPIQNVEDLMLSDEVIAAVAKEEFNIYAISNVEEGLEILTGKKAGQVQDDGTYPEGTINYLVQEKINKWSKDNNEEE
jgi:lon-related putative ATP-dependent protease